LSKSAELLPLAGLAVMACLFWSVDVIGSGRTVAAFQNVDLFTEFYPRHAFAAASLRRGSVPLWDSHQIGGLPFLATLQAGVFYPPNLLYALLPIGTAMGVLALAHMFLAGALTFLLARELGASRAAGALAGVTFMLGGSTVSLLYHTNAIDSAPWLPAAVLCTWRLAREADARWALWLGAVLALQFLAGRDYTFVMTVHAVALLALLQVGWMARDGAGAARIGAHLGRLAAAGALAAGIVCVQLLPTLALTAQGERGLSGLPPELREIYGPLPAAFFLANLLNPVRGVVRREYVGWIPLVCFVLGFRLWGRERATCFASLLATLAAVLCLGSQTPLYAAYRLLPLGATFRLPDRFVFLFAFGVALVAAAGFDRVFSGRLSFGAGWRALSPIVLALLGMGMVLTLVLDGRWMAAGLRRASEPWGWFTFHGFEPGHFAALGRARWYFAAVAALVALGLWRPASSAAAWLRVAVVVLAAADLGYAQVNRTLHPARDATPAVAGAECYERAAALAGPLGRHLSFRTRASWALKDKDGELFEAHAVTHYDPLVTRRQALYFRALQQGGVDIVPTPWNERSPFMGFLTRYPPAGRAKLLDLMGVRAVLVDAGETASPGLKGLLSRLEPAARCTAVDGARPLTIDVFSNEHALPRAFVVHDVEHAADGQAAIARLLEADFDPRRAAVVEGDGASPPEGGDAGGESRAEVVAYDDTLVSVHAVTSRPGLLVLTDSYDADWVATRNGDPTTIHPTDGLFRGVVLPAGTSEVVFRYAPTSFRLGLLLSVVSACVWGALCYWTRAPRAMGGR
jgi:hypothetical protein